MRAAARLNVPPVFTPSGGFIKPGQNIKINGESKPVNDIYKTILTTRATEIKNDVQRKDILEAINNARDIDNLQDIINSVLNDLKVPLSGGRKTRKHKKHGRKTKRKQRGGFHYSERAHRRRITTSSSSRRSSRRSSSRRSSRR